MYLKRIDLFNFRRFATMDDEIPGLSVEFHKGLNVVVGENDSGKTAIIDAIKLLVGNVSDEYQKIHDEDFFCSEDGNFTKQFSIEGVFTELNEREAGIFLDWLSFDENGDYELRLKLLVEKKENDNRQVYIERKLVAGGINSKIALRASAKSFLKSTYLKALRNVNDELTPGFRSQLPKILAAHSGFKNNQGAVDKLVNTVAGANEEVEKFFSIEDNKGHSINGDLMDVLSNFYDQKDKNKSQTKFQIATASLDQILKQLSLNPQNINLGLGNMNLLFIATEVALLENHVNSVIYGPNIMLIEELEAHLHVQAQIRLIKYIESYISTLTRSTVQFILTSHSTALTASIDQAKLIYMYGGHAFSMNAENTLLNSNEYDFLNRFLDATKCNLFFAKGILLVEGYAENILIPAFAELLDFSLHDNGISIVNVGGTSFQTYVKLFSRRNTSERIKLPISIITDSDIRPYEYKLSQRELEIFDDQNVSYDIIDDSESEKGYESFNKLARAINLEYPSVCYEQLLEMSKKSISDDQIVLKQTDVVEKKEKEYSDLNANLKINVSSDWTLEYTLLLSPLYSLELQAIMETRFVNRERQNTEIQKNKDLHVIHPHKAAYEAFLPLDKGNVSKSIVSQRLAQKIKNLAETDKKSLKKEILKDKHCKYLVNAIFHAGGKELEEDEN